MITPEVLPAVFYMGKKERVGKKRRNRKQVYAASKIEAGVTEFEDRNFR